MGEIFPTSDLSKEQIIAAYERMSDDLKKEYDANLILKRENINLRIRIESIESKLRKLLRIEF